MNELSSAPTPRVFVTKFQPDWNFTPAAKFGQVKFLTEKEPQYEPTLRENTDRVIIEIRNGLNDYIPGVDYIVMTASAINNVLASHVALSKPGLHQFLRWNSHRSDPNNRSGYRLYTIRT